MRITTKLTGLLAVLVVLVLGAEAWFRTTNELALYRADAEQDQRVIGQAITEAVVHVWRATGREPALALLARARAADDRVQVRWVPARAGTAAGKSRPRTRSSTSSTSWLSPVTLTTTIPALEGGRLLGNVVISERLDVRHRYLISVIRGAVLVGLITLVAWISIIWAVGRAVVGAPVQKLVAYARRIGDGHFDEPAPLAQRDELGELSGELYLMARHLAEARATLDAEAAARVRAVEQLRHADRLTTVGRLASGVAHEVGTPLNVVHARAEMIEQGEADDPRDSARVIREQAERITRIVRQLLDFARKRSGERHPHDLAPAAHGVGEMLQSLARKHGVELRVDAPAAGLVVPAAGGELEQVMINLVMNAIQASPKGGKVVLVAERGEAEPPQGQPSAPVDCVVLRVTDEGPGIPEDVAPHIFDPFFTTKDVGVGTGLGLSVSYGIVAEHHGWIVARDRAGVGTEFVTYLPCQPES